MPGIIPNVSSGALPVTDPLVQGEYIPGVSFSFTCPYLGLPSTCDARITPAQINGFTSEMVALAECWTPSGTWDCNSSTNLCTAFRSYVTSTTAISLANDVLAALKWKDCNNVPLVVGDQIAKCSNLVIPLWTETVQGIVERIDSTEASVDHNFPALDTNASLDNTHGMSAFHTNEWFNNNFWIETSRTYTVPGDFATLNQAYDYLQQHRISERATVTINLGGGTLTLTGNIAGHIDGRRIVVNGQPLVGAFPRRADLVVTGSNGANRTANTAVNSPVIQSRFGTVIQCAGFTMQAFDNTHLGTWNHICLLNTGNTFVLRLGASWRYFNVAVIGGVFGLSVTGAGVIGTNFLVCNCGSGVSMSSGIIQNNGSFLAVSCGTGAFIRYNATLLNIGGAGSEEVIIGSAQGLVLDGSGNYNFGAIDVYFDRNGFCINASAASVLGSRGQIQNFRVTNSSLYFATLDGSSLMLGQATNPYTIFTINSSPFALKADAGSRFAFSQAVIGAHTTNAMQINNSQGDLRIGCSVAGSPIDIIATHGGHVYLDATSTATVVSPPLNVNGNFNSMVSK